MYDRGYSTDGQLSLAYLCSQPRLRSASNPKTLSDTDERTTYSRISKPDLWRWKKSNRCWRSIVQRVRNLRAARPGDSDGFDPVGGGLEARANLFRLSGEPPRAQQREASVSSLSISLPVWAPLSRMAGTSCVPLFFLSVLRAHLAS